MFRHSFALGFLLAALALVAQESAADYVLRFPPAGIWAISDPHTADPISVTRWWSDGAFIDEDPCAGLEGQPWQDCLVSNPAISGNLFELPFESGALSVFVPTDLWFTPALYDESSLSIPRREIGESLRDAACSTLGCVFSLGLGNFGDTEPSTFFPQDFWTVVSTQSRSFAQLKALYGTD